MILKRSTSIHFHCLIYRFYLESMVDSIHQLDSLIEIHDTLDASFIKVEENLMALWQASH